LQSLKASSYKAFRTMSIFWNLALLMFFSQQLFCHNTAAESTAVKDADSDQQPSKKSVLTNSEIGTEIELSGGQNMRRTTRLEDLVTPDNTVDLIGETVSLKCRGYSQSQNIQWHFLAVGSRIPIMIVNRCRINLKFVDLYEVDKADQACNLIIESLTLDLAGTYICTDRTIGISRSSAQLVVLKSEPMCKSTTDRMESLNDGTFVDLTCIVRYAGPVAPTMEWLHENDTIIPSDPVESNESRVKTSLTVVAKIPSLIPYRCKTFFKKERIVPKQDKVHRAANQLDYTTCGNRNQNR